MQRGKERSVCVREERDRYIEGEWELERDKDLDNLKRKKYTSLESALVQSRLHCDICSTLLAFKAKSSTASKQANKEDVLVCVVRVIPRHRVSVAAIVVVTSLCVLQQTNIPTCSSTTKQNDHPVEKVGKQRSLPKLVPS